MFEIATPTSGKIIKVNPRDEHHGPESIPAADVKIEVILPNYVLDNFARGLLDAMYEEDNYNPPQGELDIGEPVSHLRHLRFPGLQPLRLNDEYLGYRLVVEKGITGDEWDGGYVNMRDCELSNIQAECKEGGYVVMQFRLSQSDIDAETLGRIGVLTGHDVPLRLLAPGTEEAEEMEDGEQS